MATVHEGKICQTILDMYNKDAIVVEPAGAMTVAVLDDYREEIKGKNLVCLRAEVIMTLQEQRKLKNGHFTVV